MDLFLFTASDILLEGFIDRRPFSPVASQVFHFLNKFIVYRKVRWHGYPPFQTIIYTSFGNSAVLMG